MKTLITSVLAFLAVGASAEVLYDSGAPELTTFVCDSGPNACLLGFNDFWTIYDDFQLHNASEVSSISFIDAVYHGTPTENYQNTRWSLYAASPATGAAPIASGISIAAVTPSSGADEFEFAINITPTSVQPGVYWLGITNEFTGGAESTPLGVYVNNPVLMPGFYQHTPVTGSYRYQQAGDRVMKIYGTSVPEPTTTTLLGIGLCGIFGATRRNRM
jgi:hypothetical protein